MPLPIVPLFDLAIRLAECICETLSDPARLDDVFSGDCCVMPGTEVPWDSCCEGKPGQAWVMVLSGGPDADQAASSRCMPATTNVRFQVGTLRCSPTGVCTSCNCNEESSRKILGDLAALQKAIWCCFPDDEDCEKPSQLTWRLVGPQGSCAGVVVEFVLPTPSGVCC